MNKKLLVSALLCFFICSLVTVAKEEKINIIEFIGRNELVGPGVPGWPALWKLDPVSNPASITEFVSDPIFLLHVPPSPKSDAIFLEWGAQYWFAWSNYEYWNAWAGIILNITSDVIPDDYEVKAPRSVLQFSQTNNYSNETLWKFQRNAKSFKDMMKRNSVGQWRVFYKGTWVPDDVAVPIINSLLDNGFDVEVCASGGIQGVKWIRLVHISLEATRLVKK